MYVHIGHVGCGALLSVDSRVRESVILVDLPQQGWGAGFISPDLPSLPPNGERQGEGRPLNEDHYDS
jgi:hypothetical protein